MMTTQETKHRVEVQVGSKQGLHARPAAKLVEAARTLEPPATIGRPDGPQVNPRSLAMVLALDADFGETLVVESEDDRSARKLAEIIASELDREEVNTE